LDRSDPKITTLLTTVLLYFSGVQVMAARYLSRKSGRGILFSPFVEVEINGADYDNAKYKTKSVSDNGFNPDWNDSFDFQIHNPDLAMYVLLTCFYES
jgi:Ca2+-dependent lipid-binding protein